MNAQVSRRHEPSECARAIEPELLLQALRSGRRITLVDVRCREDFRGVSGLITGARSMPMHQLMARQQELASHLNDLVVVISGTGIRARIAADALANAGFAEVMFLEGGMSRWLFLGYPVEHARISSLPCGASIGKEDLS